MKKWKRNDNKCPSCGSMVRFGTETVVCPKCKGEWKLDHARVTEVTP